MRVEFGEWRVEFRSRLAPTIENKVLDASSIAVSTLNSQLAWQRPRPIRICASNSPPKGGPFAVYFQKPSGYMPSSVSRFSAALTAGRSSG